MEDQSMSNRCKPALRIIRGAESIPDDPVDTASVATFS
jgi:hypothetical protein